MKQMFARYVQLVAGGEYPAASQTYAMPPQEKAQFEKGNHGALSEVSLKLR
jgi:hypothetical protein